MTTQQLFLLDQLRLWQANDWLDLLKQFIQTKGTVREFIKVSNTFEC